MWGKTNVCRCVCLYKGWCGHCFHFLLLVEVTVPALIMRNSVMELLWDCTRGEALWWMLWRGVCQLPPGWSPPRMEGFSVVSDRNMFYETGGCEAVRITACGGSTDHPAPPLQSDGSFHIRLHLYFSCKYIVPESSYHVLMFLKNTKP